MNYKKDDILICKKRLPTRHRFVNVGERCRILSIWNNVANINDFIYDHCVFDMEIDKDRIHTSLRESIITEHFESITEHRNRIINELI